MTFSLIWYHTDGEDCIVFLLSFSTDDVTLSRDHLDHNRHHGHDDHHDLHDLALAEVLGVAIDDVTRSRDHTEPALQRKLLVFIVIVINDERDQGQDVEIIISWP